MVRAVQTDRPRPLTVRAARVVRKVRRLGLLRSASVIASVWVCVSSESATAAPKPKPITPPSSAEVQPGSERPQPARPPDDKDPEDDKKRGGNVLVPLVLYTPETHLGAGALFVHFFRATEHEGGRVSSLAVVALVTTRKQAILELHPDVYLNGDSLHFFGKLEYQYFPDSFWGIGNDTRDADEERYQRERAHFRGGVQQRIIGPVYGGVHGDVMTFWGHYSDPNGIFATQDIPGEAGGFTFGFGPMLTFDSRDNAVASYSGTLLNGSLLWFDDAIGSNYQFLKLAFDARQFFTVARDQVLGMHFLTEHQAGDVPYYQLAMLGGDELLRGYYLGRYRDTNLAALDVEYRFPIYWRFGGVTFAGAGVVAEQIDELWSAPIRWAVGGGLRFSLNSDERLNLRLDAGVGPSTHGIYFTAREAF